MRPLIGKAMPLLVYLLVSVVALYHFVEPGYYLALDMQWGPNTFADFHFDDLYGNTINPYGAYLPVFLLFSALAKYLSVDVIQKLMLFSIMLFSGLSAHFSLPGKMGNSRYAAGLFYMLNPFFLVRFLAGHWALLFSYAVWPLAITLFSGFLEKPKDDRLLAAVAISTFAVAVSSHGLAMLLLAYLVIFVFHLVFKAREYKDLVIRVSMLGAIVLLMNLFWILPTVVKFNSIYSPASAQAYFQDFGAKGYELPVGFAVFSLHGFWRDYLLTKDFFEPWSILFALLVGYSAFGIFSMLKKETVKSVSLAFIFLISFFLALGDSSPLSFLFEIFGNDIPIYFFFRDSQKFVALMAYVYSISLAYGTYHLGRRYGKAAIAVPLLAIMLSNIAFFGLAGQIWPVEYPSDWAAADQIIANDTHDSNIVVFPLHLYRPYQWAGGLQKVLASPASQFFSKRIVTAANLETVNVYSDKVDSRGYYLSTMFNERRGINNTAQLLLPLNGRYVLLFKDDADSPHYLFLFMRYGGMADIELVYECDEFYLFRNNLDTGPLMSEDGAPARTLEDAIEGGIETEGISYVKRNPARYDVISSDGELVVMARPPSDFITYEGQGFTRRYAAAAEAPYSGPGAIENIFFPITLFLILLSWLMLSVLIMGYSQARLLALSLASAAAFYLVYEGIWGPSDLGLLMALGILISGLFVANRRMKWFIY